MPIKFEYASQDEIPDHPDIRSSYTEQGGKWVLALPGLKTEADIAKMRSALEKERTEHKATKERWTALADFGDPNELADKLARLPELEAAAKGKLDDGEIERIVSGRLKGATTPLERQLKKLTEERDMLAKQATELVEANRRREIRDDVLAALREAKVIPEAHEDALLLAERVFERTEEGRTLIRDGVGYPPGLDARGWLTEMAEKRPHWWPPSQGAGARGSQGGGIPGGAQNPWSATGWNITAQGRYVQQHGMERAKAMAAAVGVDLNNPVRPQAPAGAGRR